MVKEKIECKHFCVDDHYCVWLQSMCNIVSDLCVYEYNQYCKKQLNNNIQLTIEFE